MSRLSFMNTINQTIPTAFAPETAFALSLQATNSNEKPREKLVVHITFDDLAMLNRERRGIPESALND